MLNKIFLAVLAAASLAMMILLYLSYDWLQSVTAPKDVVESYRYYANVGWVFLLISALLLLVVGNVVLWTTRRAWAMWAALAYFAVFMILHTFWLENSFFRYQQANNLDDSLFSWSPLVGVFLIVFAAIIVFFNQYLVKRMRDKTLPATETLPAENLSEESAIEEKNV